MKMAVSKGFYFTIGTAPGCLLPLSGKILHPRIFPLGKAPDILFFWTGTFPKPLQKGYRNG